VIGYCEVRSLPEGGGDVVEIVIERGYCMVMHAACVRSQWEFSDYPAVVYPSYE